MAARRVIFGGTFDPIHIGHLAIAEDVRFALNAQHVLFVPAAQQPLKTQRHTASAADRLAMVQLATADNPCFAVSDLEVQRGGKSYTIDTINELQGQYRGDELFFAVGADAAADLARWYKIHDLIERCRIAIVRRPGYAVEIAALVGELNVRSDRLILIDGPAFDVSATELRARLRDGRPVRYHLPAAVYQYIEQRNLYREPKP